MRTAAISRRFTAATHIIIVIIIIIVVQSSSSSPPPPMIDYNYCHRFVYYILTLLSRTYGKSRRYIPRRVHGRAIIMYYNGRGSVFIIVARRIDPSRPTSISHSGQMNRVRSCAFAACFDNDDFNALS